MRHTECLRYCRGQTGKLEVGFAGVLLRNLIEPTESKRSETTIRKTCVCLNSDKIHKLRLV